jgi:hypothetical protein
VTVTHLTGVLSRTGVQGDDRFRHCLRNCEKRVEDAGLSRKRSLQNNKCQFNAH